MPGVSSGRGGVITADDGLDGPLGPAGLFAAAMEAGGCAAGDGSAPATRLGASVGCGPVEFTTAAAARGARRGRGANRRHGTTHRGGANLTCCVLVKGQSWPLGASEGPRLLWTLCGPDHRSEKNFDLNLFQVILVDLNYLVKSFLLNRLLSFAQRPGAGVPPPPCPRNVHVSCRVQCMFLEGSRKAAPWRGLGASLPIRENPFARLGRQRQSSPLHKDDSR